MAFRGRLGAGAKPPGERAWTAAPAEPQPTPVPDSAADRGQRDERAVELRRSGLTYVAIAEALGIGEATARRAVLGLDRHSAPSRRRAKDLPEVVKGRDGKVHRASWSVKVDRAEGARRQEPRHP